MASLCIAYINVGSTCIIVFVLEFVMYGTMFFGMHRYGTERVKCLAETDKRVKLISDVCNGIRTVKYYCWEKPFKGKVHDLRTVELKNTEKMAWIMSAGVECMMGLIPNVVPLVCFSLYPSVMGKPLTSSVAFTSFTLFNMLQMPFAMLPMIAFMFVQFK